MFKPNFTITPAILSGISEITEIKSVIERSRVLPLNQAQLQRQAIARMVHTSTSIEGNPLAQYQVDKVLSGEEISADQKSIIEVKNYQKALQEMEKIAQTGKHVDLEAILHIHKILMEGLLEKEKIGHFRPGSVYIVDDLGDKGDKLRFEAPSASKVAFLTDQLLQWFYSPDAKNLHPVLKAGLFHSQFVHIHPFVDGNGRITRLLTQLVLYMAGWDFRKVIVLEDYYNRNRQAYYNGLSEGWEVKYKEGSDFTPWLEYFVKGFWVEAMKAGELIEKIGFNRVTNESDQIFLDRDETEIMDFLVTTGRITSQDVEEILHIAKRTAQLKLKTLVDKGLLKVEGSGPSTYYTIAG